MADCSEPPSRNLYGVRRLTGVCRICKSFIKKCYPSQKVEGKHKSQNIQQGYKAFQDHNNCSEVAMNGKDEFRYNNKVSENTKSHDNAYFGTRSPLSSPPSSRSTSPFLHPRSASPSPLSRSTSPSPLSRSSSRRSQTPIRAAAANLLRSMSRRKSGEGLGASPPPSSLSRNPSRWSSTPIIYSNSNKVALKPALKPAPMQKTLECTLEELCFGSIKKIKITRDVVMEDGQMIQEDEVLTIKVKPGWRKGTMITFEGMGNEMAGADPADVIFTIAEKRHRLYSRQGEDLEFAVEIPLVNALSGCSLPIPLLSGEKKIVTIDDVIYPGLQKIIEGQGMPKPDQPTKRGNLTVTLLVKFPTELTEDQRSDIYTILQDSC